MLVQMKHLAFILAPGKKKGQGTEKQGRKGLVGYSITSIGFSIT